MRKRVLVFPCGSEIGLELHRSLEKSLHYELIGGSSTDDHGKFVYKNYIDGIPNVDDDDFISRLNDIVVNNNIDYIFPAHDSVVKTLAVKNEAQQLRCGVIASNAKTCQITRSKVETYQLLKNVISVPIVYEEVDLLNDDFPLFLKPDVGQGSKGTHLVKNVNELRFYKEQDPTLMILEYLPGLEYTVDCFTDRHGNLTVCEGRQRRRILNGISVNSVNINDERFRAIAEKINAQLTFRGVWFFQLKERENGELTLLEVAPRIAGTMGLLRGRGINLALMSLFDADNIDVTAVINQYDSEIDRALENKYKHNLSYDHVYIDLDDLIIIDNKINLAAITFLYQCVNDKIKIHLLTKHAYQVDSTLKRFRIDSLFDETIHISEKDSKYKYIKEDNAIFIDDSFTERKEVKDKLSISVFDTHMIESLIH